MAFEILTRMDINEWFLIIFNYSYFISGDINVKRVIFSQNPTT